MKPIEPGCLAMVVGARHEATWSNIGKIVRVVCLDAISPREWQVEGDGVFGILGPSSAAPVVALESSLLRIDGHEPEAADTTMDEEIEA